MKNTEKKSLFGYVNALSRSEGKFMEALLGYELLEDINPSFPFYSENKNNILKKLKKEEDKKKLIKNKYHYKSASEYQKRLRVADIFAANGDLNAVLTCFDGFSSGDETQHFLAIAKADIASGDTKSWLKNLNFYLKSKGVRPVFLTKTEGSIFQKLRKPDSLISASVNGPLVTVCISCFNAENYVEKAVTSILQQTYKNIELIIFNDKSTDGTLGILQKLSLVDPRIILIDNKKNQGTYVSRNQALQRAKGEFFTILDGDDYALPDRLEIQVKHLLKNKAHMGVLTEWVRMEENGFFHFKGGWGGCYQHEAVATLMLRTERVKSDIGYWDSVRFAADTEYLFRMRKFYGDENVPLLDMPTAISLYHENSLTNNPVTGIGVGGVGGLSPVRIKYRESWLKWHEEANNLYLPYPLIDRSFEAPFEMIA